MKKNNIKESSEIKMSPEIEDSMKTKTHHLGNHPSFPDVDGVDLQENIVFKTTKKNIISIIKNKFMKKNNIKESSEIKMSPEIEDNIKTKTHHLGNHPSFPDVDGVDFTEKLLLDRFNNVVNNVKKHYSINEINNDEILKEIPTLIEECIELEKEHKKQLEDLCISAVMDEFDIPESFVTIKTELTPNIDLKGLNKEPKGEIDEIEFENYDDISNLKTEIQKRHLINTLIQGSAMKIKNVLHKIDDQLTDINPILLNKYNKLISAIDYSYFIIKDFNGDKYGGVVKTTIPKNNDGKTEVDAKGVVFPILLYETMKGVMEVLAANGLPQDDKKTKYILGRTDYLESEPWNMRLGVGLWDKFVKLIPQQDIHLKHYIFAELCSLEANEFLTVVKEILSNTKKGKTFVETIIKKTKKDLQQEEFDLCLEEKRKLHKNQGYITNPQDIDNVWSNLGL